MSKQMLVPEQGVIDIASGRSGIIVRRITSEVFEVLFGLRRGAHIIKTMTTDQLRPCDLQEILDWRASQGYDGSDVQIWRKANGYPYSDHHSVDHPL